MNPLYTLQYADFGGELNIPTGEKEFDFEACTAHRWGRYAEKNVSLDHIRFYEARAQLHQPFQVIIDHAGMPDEVHFCAVLDGSVQGSFCEERIVNRLHAGHHHYLYAPHEQYTLTFQDVHYLHVAICREYYINLLEESRDWVGQLRSRLVRQDIVQASGMPLQGALQPLVGGMLHTPLQGNLRDLMLEARVLELIALQLDQYSSSAVYGAGSGGIRKKDQELFHAIRDHLRDTFLEAHSLRGLSRAFGINEFKLKKGFREYFGTTVFSFLQEARMQHAYRLLADEHAYVHEVAGQVGYKNANHFSTAFRKQFGMSPGALKPR